MPTYITLINYTQHGVETMKDTSARLAAAKNVFESMGAKLVAYYLTMGQYDAMVIGEGPDDETVARLALTIAGQGAVRTETFRAFTEDEAMEIIASLP